MSSRKLPEVATLVLVLIVSCATLASTIYSTMTLGERLSAIETALELRIEPIRIGGSVSLTGKYADSGRYYWEAYTMWKDEINKEGGLLGRPVEIILYDDKSDPDEGLSLYEKLITVDKVDLIFGPYTSTIIYPVSAIAEKYEMLFLQGGGNAMRLFERGFKWMFLTLPGYGGPGDIIYKLLQTIPAETRPKTIAIIYGDRLASISERDVFVELAAEFGFEVVNEEKYPAEVTDLTSVISNVKASEAEILLGCTYFPDSVLTVRACMELGYNPKAIWLSVGPAMPDWYPALEENGEYIMGQTYFDITSKLSGVAEFVENYRMMWGKDPDYHAGGAYAVCQVMEEAIRATGSIENEVLREYVAANRFDTVIASLKWDERGLPEEGRLLCVWMDGEMRIIWPPEAATAEFVYPKPPWG